MPQMRRGAISKRLRLGGPCLSLRAYQPASQQRDTDLMPRMSGPPVKRYSTAPARGEESAHVAAAAERLQAVCSRRGIGSRFLDMAGREQVDIQSSERERREGEWRKGRDGADVNASE